MIDKIIVKIPSNISIKHDANIRVHPLGINQMDRDLIREGRLLHEEPLLYANSAGEEIRGEKAEMHNDLYSISIRPQVRKIRFNFPKTTQYGVNLYPVDQDEAINVVQIVQDCFYKNGIDVKLNSAKLMYLEIYKNLRLTRPYSDYTNALNWLEVKRGLENNLETTYYFGNRNRKLVFYNKTAQLIDKKIIKKETGRIITGSLMRAEYRLYNKDVILRELGLGTLNDLIESWNNLKGLFNVSVESFLHRYDQKAPPSNLELKTESDRLKYFFDKYGTRSGWNNYRKHLGSGQIMENWDNVSDLKDFLRHYRVKQAVYRDMKELRSDSMALPVSSKQSVVGLLQEFKSMLLS